MSIAMRCLVTLLLAVAVATAFPADENAPASGSACAPTGVPYVRTTLYFGLARPAGTITERQWKQFLRSEVTTRFPQGFTVWEADGQWRVADGRIARERAKVLLLVHSGSPEIRDALAELVTSYK